MEPYSSEDKKQRIIEALKKIEDFNLSFQLDFYESITEILSVKESNSEESFDLDEFILMYGQQIFSATESVIDKDNSYPDYRLNDELNRMTKLIDKRIKIGKSLDVHDAIQNKVKELMVKYFPAVYDLSGNGFRLMELNARYYYLEFEAGLGSHLKG